MLCSSLWSLPVFGFPAKSPDSGRLWNLICQHLKKKNPQLEVVNELIRGQHPHLKGLYKNHNQRVICVKNLTAEDILLHATRLRNALGRNVVKLRTRHVTRHPSVQGTWTTALKF